MNWKQIPTFPDYAVSDIGSVKRLTSPKRNRNYGPIKGSKHKGYTFVCLRTTKGEKKRLPVHRLVMLTFVGESSLHVNHKNGLKSDNRLENLEYVTDAQNRAHAKTVLDAFPKGSKHPNSKLKEHDVLNILNLIDSGASDCMIAKVFGCTSANIWHIRKGKAWSHLSIGPRPANYKGRLKIN